MYVFFIVQNKVKVIIVPSIFKHSWIKDWLTYSLIIIWNRILIETHL